MPSRATTIVSLILFAACASIYYLTTDVITSPAAVDPAMATIKDLQVELTALEELPSRLKVTVRNSHASCPITFLTWDTPLDASAVNTGVLSITNADSGESIPGPGLKLSRQLPPSREDLVELPAQKMIEKQIELNVPWLPKDVRVVDVHGEGSFRAIWPKAEKDVSDEELKALGGENALTGTFASSRDARIRLE